MKKYFVVILFLGNIVFLSNAYTGDEKKPDPKTLSWKATLVSKSEPGEPIIISGIVYKADSKTPLEGAMLYLYHTDNNGLYGPKGSPDGTIRIKGWVKTNGEGKYEFRTIMPKSYPNMRNEAHIHVKLIEPGGREYWIDEFLFDRDPYLRKETIEKYKKEGLFSPVVKLEKGNDGILRGIRNIKAKE